MIQFFGVFIIIITTFLQLGISKKHIALGFSQLYQ